MWNIINKTPFAAAGGFVRDDNTAKEIWIVAVKATFDIALSGKLTVAKDQPPPCKMPVYRDQVTNSSLLYDCDLVPVKNRVDILLDACAHAPNGEEVTELIVGVRVGAWSKFLKVIGSRMWQRELGLLFKTMPLSFKRKPIIYEVAYGGRQDENEASPFFEARNPVGIGYSAKRSQLAGRYLPMIEYSKYPSRKRPKKNQVAGFGPICGHWRPRRELSGTYDEEWQKRPHLRPKDFDTTFYQSAPADQQVATVHPGDEVTLYNLTSGKGFLQFNLPELWFGFETKIRNSLQQHTARLHTLIIEPEFPRFSQVWTTTVPCHQQEQFLEHTTVTHRLKF